MGKTTIEWCRNDDGSLGHSWPIVNGCRRVSPGCGGARGVGGCYAERLISTRLRKTKKYGGLATFTAHGPQWTGESRLWLPDLTMPLKLRKPSRIFVADMGDLFYEEVDVDEIAAVFGVMAAAPRHTFQVLTKRSTRMREVMLSPAFRAQVAMFKRLAESRRIEAYFGLPPEDTGAPDYLVVSEEGAAVPWPLPNVHLGVSVEDQKRADERIPDLCAIPAAIRFLSCEPLLERVDIGAFLWESGHLDRDTMEWVPGGFLRHARARSWVIVGGESGPGSRPFDLQWARRILADCAKAGTPAFFKQAGARPFDSSIPVHVVVTNPEAMEPVAMAAMTGLHPSVLGLPRETPIGVATSSNCLQLRDRKGGDLAELPLDLHVRQFPKEVA
jgi:protein gp37